MKLGDVYRADLERGGTHPVVVVSRAEPNQGNYVLAVVCTSARLAFRRTLRNCVPLSAGPVFAKDCVAQCENVLSIHKEQLIEHLGTLAEKQVREVIRAVGYVMEAECEPE